MLSEGWAAASRWKARKVVTIAPQGAAMLAALRERAKRNGVRPVTFGNSPARDHLITNCDAGTVTMVGVDALVEHTIDGYVVAGACARYRIGQLHFKHLASFEYPRSVRVRSRRETLVGTPRGSAR